MTVEVLLLAVLAGIALLAYMIAINAHGPTRLGLSYLIATIILAGTVWAVVQYVNTGLDSQKTEELRRLELEKRRAEEQLMSKEKALEENRDRMQAAARLNTIITEGTALAASMTNVDLQDHSVSLDVLIGRASAAVKNAKEHKENFTNTEINDTYFQKSTQLIDEAIQLINEAAYYYRAYYYSEDSDQEELRERIMRQKARKAHENYKEASSLVSESLPE